MISRHARTSIPGPVGLVLLLATATQAATQQEAYLPPYAQLFAKVETLEQQGELEKALRGLPAVYASEIPVTAFYETLTRKKRGLLEELLGRESAPELRLFYEHYLTKPDTLQSAVRIDEDLPPERFYYFEIVAESVEHPAALVASEDEWLVAAALFLARKGEFAIDAETVLERWQARPDLWDEVCTDQALLYLATLPRGELGLLEVHDAHVAGRLRHLEEPAPDHATVHARMFWTEHAQPNLDLETGPLTATMRLEGDDGEKVLDLSDLEDGLLRLPEGSYRLHHVEGSADAHGSYSGTYGESRHFDARKGTFVRVFVPITGGV